MWVHLNFMNGTNPYIVTSNKEMFEVIKAFDLKQTGEVFFDILGNVTYYTTKGRKLTAREKGKIALSNFAKEWQNYFPECSYTWSELVSWCDFFTEYGKKYGLVREFKENGII